MKSVLFFGFYDRNYARTKVLKNGFERNDWQVSECHVDPRYRKHVAKYIQLFFRGLAARRRDYDLILVGFPGHNAVWVARLLFGKRIVFDAFLSNYDANLDRKLYTKDSWRAKKDKWLDAWSCRLAGKVLVDTEALKDFFSKEFATPKEKIVPVPISADDTMFFPKNVMEDSVFTVHFHGTFIPLQGVSHIIDAADILRNENIRFRLVGGGQEAGMIEAKIQKLGLASVVERIQKVPVDQIPKYMASAHVVLGIFGDVVRAKRAIPNKVYEAMAMGKAIITEDSVAIRELQGHEKAFALVPPGDGMAIAMAIRKLRDDSLWRLELGRAARALFEERLVPERIVSELLVAIGSK